jgi:hypothetical protein
MLSPAPLSKLFYQLGWCSTLAALVLRSVIFLFHIERSSQFVWADAVTNASSGAELFVTSRSGVPSALHRVGAL